MVLAVELGDRRRTPGRTAATIIGRSKPDRRRALGGTAATIPGRAGSAFQGFLAVIA